MNKRYLISLSLIVFSLWLGVQFYVQPGNEVPLIKKIAELFWIPIILLPDLPGFLNDSLSDGLWMMALGSTIIAIWDHTISYPFIIFYGISILVGLGFEFGQAVRIIQGTFDIYDCLAIIMGGLVPLILLSKKQHYEYKC
ncbi:MAG: hypothetical protein HKN68_11010 [Saprospiraceae bacterium]|nr:hypothetical protein [Saprospiraceae bacterium]